MSTIVPVAAWQRHRRLAVAKGLERIVAEAERPYVPSAAVPMDRRAVREARGALLELAAWVRDVTDAPPSALDAVRRLLVDPYGPLFRPTSPRELRSAADLAREGLEGGR